MSSNLKKGNFLHLAFDFEIVFNGKKSTSLHEFCHKYLIRYGVKNYIVRCKTICISPYIWEYEIMILYQIKTNSPYLFRSSITIFVQDMIEYSNFNVIHPWLIQLCITNRILSCSELIISDWPNGFFFCLKK